MDREFLCGLGIADDTADTIISRYSDEINDLKLDFAVERELSKRGAKSISAAMKLIDKQGLVYENDKVEGLTQRIDEFAAENDFLFETGDIKPVFSKQPASSAGITKSEFEKMGYEKRLRLFNESPEVYKSLING